MLEISLCICWSCTNGTTDSLVRVGYVLPPTVFRVGCLTDSGSATDGHERVCFDSGTVIPLFCQECHPLYYVDVIKHPKML
ncbi:unnamed protein product [Camellia sinensis]